LSAFWPAWVVEAAMRESVMSAMRPRNSGAAAQDLLSSVMLPVYQQDLHPPRGRIR
jgi:hypothetical protein